MRSLCLNIPMPAVLSLLLTGCAPQGLYYWGDYESSLYERYVENGNQQSEAYLRSTFTEAEARHRKVPPGVYADYGFQQKDEAIQSASDASVPAQGDGQ